METTSIAALVSAALGLGALVGWLLGRQRGQIAEARAAERLTGEARANAEKLAILATAEAELREAFQALASDALRQNNRNFLELAKAKLDEARTQAKGDLDARKKEVETLVTPLRETLKGLDVHVTELEKRRVRAYAQITAQIGQLATSQQHLQRETANLVKALRSPAARGRWGEIQLKRVVEMVGMLEHCDFTQQESVDTDDGRLRPDMIVRLPGGACVVVDAKTPLAAYLEAVEAEDDATRAERLKDHARQVRAHLAKLGAKAYWEQFEPSPQFVVLFLPSETFFGAALQEDPALIEAGVEQRVIVATPTTLIALLRAVAYGWQNEQVRKNAEEIRQLGNDLYQRISRFIEHLAGVRKGLTGAVDAYDRAVGSLESRVLPQARRFRELGASTSAEIESIPPIGRTPRALEVPELAGSAEDSRVEETTSSMNHASTRNSSPVSPAR